MEHTFLKLNRVTYMKTHTHTHPLSLTPSNASNVKIKAIIGLKTTTTKKKTPTG